MAIITIDALWSIVPLILILISLLLTFLIILRTDKKICASHKFLFAGFIIFGILKIFEMLAEFRIIEFSYLYSLIFETIFILLFIIGFWKMHQGVKEAINNSGKKHAGK
nr:hypothetical protein [Candidatus Woesearchaeota archaeon]